jgi:hypothetical protein
MQRENEMALKTVGSDDEFTEGELKAIFLGGVGVVVVILSLAVWLVGALPDATEHPRTTHARRMLHDPAYAAADKAEKDARKLDMHRIICNQVPAPPICK